MSRRPNIIIFLTDQQTRHALGCAGNPDVDTPHIDQIAQQGSICRRAYSNNPVCGPYRGTLLTGCYSSRTGILRNGDPLPDDRPLFAGLFNEADYQTSWIGKWHPGGNGNELVQRHLQGAFQRFMGYQCYNHFTEGIIFHDHQERTHSFQGHRTDITTDLAIKEIRELSQNKKPFILFVSYQAPHYPLQPSAEFLTPYLERPIHLRANCHPEIEPYTSTGSPRSPRPKETDPTYDLYGGDLIAYLRHYYALCTQVDAGIGRIAQEIGRCGLSESTAIFYTSDHGDMQGSHGLVNKRRPHEESAGVPLIVSIPGMDQRPEFDRVVSGIDLLPTCLELAGMTQPPAIDGRSFLKDLNRGTNQESKGCTFVESRNWCMVVEGDWKLVAEFSDGNIEPYRLFHLENDPFEMSNLITEPNHAVRTKNMATKLHQWRAEMTAS